MPGKKSLAWTFMLTVEIGRREQSSRDEVAPAAYPMLTQLGVNWAHFC
jgi:hypothetical protein